MSILEKCNLNNHIPKIVLIPYVYLNKKNGFQLQNKLNALQEIFLKEIILQI